MSNDIALYQIASTLWVEAIDDTSLAVYNEKYNDTQIISIDFEWLINLLKKPTNYSLIAKTFALTYPDTPSDTIPEQLSELLNVFEKNNLIKKVA